METYKIQIIETIVVLAGYIVVHYSPILLQVYYCVLTIQ